jgi:ketosteroid isomerase-like protein
MDSMAGPVDPRTGYADSPNLRVVKDAFDAVGEGEIQAAIDHLLSHAEADVEFLTYVAAGQVLRGPDEVRAYYRGQLEAGTMIVAKPLSFEDCGDQVVVNGSIRVARPAAGLAESQISWTFSFRDGRLREVRWGPRKPA